MSPKTDEAMLPPTLPREEPLTPIPGRPETYITQRPPKAVSGQMRAVLTGENPPTREEWREALKSELEAIRYAWDMDFAEVKEETQRVSQSDKNQNLKAQALEGRLIAVEGALRELNKGAKEVSKETQAATVATNDTKKATDETLVVAKKQNFKLWVVLGVSIATAVTNQVLERVYPVKAPVTQEAHK